MHWRYESSSLACVPAQTFFFFPQDAFVPSAALSEVHPRLLVLSLKWLQSDSPCVWMHVLFFGLVSEWYLLPSAPRKLSLSSNWLPRRADSSNRHAGCSSSLLSQFISPQRPLLSLSVSISLFISSSSPQTTRSVIGSSGGKPPPAEETKLLHNLKEGKGGTHSSLDLCFASCFSDFFTVFVVFSPFWLFKCLRAENTRLLVFLLSSFIPRLSFPAHHSSPSLSLMHTVTVYDTVL